VLLAGALMWHSAAAWAGGKPPKPLGPILNQQLVAAAQPDECFQSIGGPRPAPPCAAGFQPKWNSQYAWGYARSGDFTYFGTGVGPCGAPSALTGVVYQPWQAEEEVCEMGMGPSAALLGPANGDNRTPKIYRINANTDQIEDITPQDADTQNLLGLAWVGIRGGAALGIAGDRDVVFLGEQVVRPNTAGAIQGIALFAFDGATGQYLGNSGILSQYAGFREGATVNGDLYIAVRLAGGAAVGAGGAVLKWTGDKTNPFQFDVVGGPFPNDIGYINVHNGQLVLSGWNNVVGRTPIGPIWGGGPAPVRMSPVVPQGGLTTATADPSNWPVIFDWGQYDPDPILAKTIFWGDAVSWKGNLYIGSYENSGPISLAGALWNQVGRPTSDLAKIADLTQASRPATVFEIKNPGQPNQQVSLLYGEALLPVFDQTTGRWTVRPNNLHQVPRLGPSGFTGNPLNIYNWNWVVLGDRLYMATADINNPGTFVPMATQIFDLGPVGQAVTDASLRVNFALQGGGDLWRLDSPNTPAVPEDTRGFGNQLNFGLRFITVHESQGFFYGGTAGAYNLKKGWQVIKFTPKQ
jgi:hypothetical protein